MMEAVAPLMGLNAADLAKTLLDEELAVRAVMGDITRFKEDELPRTFVKDALERHHHAKRILAAASVREALDLLTSNTNMLSPTACLDAARAFVRIG